ncbi:hypothetical protein BGT96224_4459 [Blumeria graminis f. sp. tritici 96224]|uniref:Uncharacterized protein n=2 Tax=Blumeria graminis f. sp. tritici 96224 TaxID=1268274 RepID=A0A656KIS9_BLUGR|nr:hypothetical protein BGT96224_4459 [Blumeria graminis f. sp. tritici 96224]
MVVLRLQKNERDKDGPGFTTISAADDARCRASLIIGRPHQSPFENWKDDSTGSVTLPTPLFLLNVIPYSSSTMHTPHKYTWDELYASAPKVSKRRLHLASMAHHPTTSSASQRDGNSILEFPIHWVKTRTTSPGFASSL